MKKLFSILLAVAMLCTMSISAFAADVTTTDDKSKDLTVKYVEGSGKKDAYAVSITWGSMEFTYTSGGQYWDTKDMKWVDSTNGSWSNSTITIMNKSSQGIKVGFGYTPAEDSKGVSGYTVDVQNGVSLNSYFVLASSGYTADVAAATPGTNNTNGTATEAEFTITPYGEYTGTNTEAVKVGTITIALS